MRDDIVSVQLTEEQRQELGRTAGLDLEVVEAAVPAFVAMALAGEAAAKGLRMTLPSMAVVRLTREQRAQLDEAGVEAEVLAFSPRPMFYEAPLTAGSASFVLCENRLVVCAEDDPVVPPAGVDLIKLTVDPSARSSFGSGRHATTRLTARLLATHLVGGERVVDVGTGSGILAIAALRLGAASVAATDIDPHAVELAKRNAATNGVSSRVLFTTGDVSTAADGPFDIALANLFPVILIDMAPDIAEAVRPGGYAIISGVVEPRMPEVGEAFEASGFETVEECTEGGWAARALVRRAG